MNLQILFLAAYLVGLVGLGLWIGRRVKSAGAFFVAGRKLSPLLIFATVLAANIGAGSTVGAAGLGYRDGLAAWWWVGSAGIGTLVLAFWVGPRIWRLAKEHDLHTVGDFLELRYGRSVRAAIAILLWFGTLAILAGQLIAFATILSAVAGVPKVTGCLIGGAVMTAYFAAGGLLSSAWVNLVQLVVLLVGLPMALAWALADAGGWSAVRAAAPGADGLDFWQGGASGWHYMALLVPAFIISPGLLQKAYGARDEKAIRLGLGLAGVALMIFAAVPPLIGMVARVHDSGLANHELALPWLLSEVLPPALGSLGLAAVLSAELSSADAILFMLSTSLSKDLYKRFYRPEASDAQVLKISRLAAVAGGGLGVLLAAVLPSVIGSLSIFYSLLSVSLFVPVIAGLYLRRAGTPEAVAAIAAGVAMLLAARLAPWALPWAPTGGIWSSTTFGLIASVLAFAVVLIARARKAG